MREIFGYFNHQLYLESYQLMDQRAIRCITAYNNLSSRVMDMKNQETMIFKDLTKRMAVIFNKMFDR